MITFREMLATKDHTPIGAFVKIPSAETIEILALAGYDFIVIDGEHAPLSVRDIDTMMVVARLMDMPPLVRIADHGYGDVQRILDAGAAGILVPHVSTREAAEQVIRQMMHPPHGTRGAGGGMRQAGFGLSAEWRDRYGNLDDVMRIPMIEEKLAVDNIEDILKVDGLSAIFIGPGDLSMSMGLKPSDPQVQEAVQTAFKAAKAAGVLVSHITGDAAGAKRLVEQGYDFIMVSNDISLLGGAASKLIKDIHS